MEQSQALQENLSQHLAMTMKMQQAIKILQLSAQDLRGVIEKEYLENPALEIDYDRAVSFAETGKSEQAYRAEDISALAAYLGGSGRGDEAGTAEAEKNPVLARPASRTLEAELMEQAARLPGGVYNYGSENSLSMYDTALALLRALGLEDKAEALLCETDQQRRNLGMDCARIRQHGICFDTTSEGFARCVADYGLRL